MDQLGESTGLTGGMLVSLHRKFVRVSIGEYVWLKTVNLRGGKPRCLSWDYTLDRLFNGPEIGEELEPRGQGNEVIPEAAAVQLCEWFNRPKIAGYTRRLVFTETRVKLSYTAALDYPNAALTLTSKPQLRGRRDLNALVMCALEGIKQIELLLGVINVS